MKRFVSLVFLGLLTLLAACSSYRAPQVQHTYVTSTQDYHKIAGVSIKWKDALPHGATMVMGGVLGLTVNFEYYVDGRLVAEHNRGRNFETYLQLPPGKHRLLVQVTERFLGTAPLNHCKSEYTFELADSQTGTLEICGECCVHFDNFKSSERESYEKSCDCKS